MLLPRLLSYWDVPNQARAYLIKQCHSNWEPYAREDLLEHPGPANACLGPFSIGIDDWSHGSRGLIEFENLNAPQVVFFGFFHVGELLLELKSSFNLSTDLAWGDVALDSYFC